jgi:hypothetical protein
MKIRILYTTFAALFAAFLFLNNSGGRASIAGEGNTGAPGDNPFNNRTCQACHNSTAIQVSLNIKAFDAEGEEALAYEAGNVYRLRVSVEPAVGSPQAYGFQMVSLIDQTQSSTNSWSNPGANVKLATPNNGRQYAEHTSPSNSNVFEVDWTAPAEGSGAVTFYASGNGVNLNGGSSGDGAGQVSFRLEEAGTVGAREEARQLQSLRLFPNPATDRLQLQLQLSQTETVEVRIFDVQGRALDQQTHRMNQGRQALLLNIQDLPNGLYLLRVSSGREVQSLSFFKSGGI